jgi:tRNA1(Val) A37 N6-methylase TrmN6
MRLINTRQAAGLLDVSETTVRNWVRHGYISPVTGAPGRFYQADLEDLKQKIAVGKIDRLRCRANKKKAGDSFVPAEYLDKPAFRKEIANIKKIFFEDNLDINHAMYALAVKQLVLLGELAFADGQTFKAARCCECRRKPLANEIAAWRKALLPISDADQIACSRLCDALTDASQDDTLGIIYQSLMQTGRKAYRGSFYTPAVLIDNIFKEYAGPVGSFLDPCCGTGQFLLRARHHGYADLSRLYGIDSDLLAVRIARINLMLAFPDSSFVPNICHADTLLHEIDAAPFGLNLQKEEFSLIASNPPWGANFTEDELRRLRQRFPAFKSRESFSFFLAKSLEMAAPGAVISFILPESFLNIGAHSDIRSYILANAQILAIHSLERPFKSVFTPVIRLDLRKEMPKTNCMISLKNYNRPEKKVVSARFTDRNSIFTTSISEEEYQIIDKIYAMPHQTLRKNADWALGIVTGDNHRYVADIAEADMEAIYRGSDVMPFRLQKGSSFIRFVPAVFQQVAPVVRYRAPEKLIYRFISRRLTFAYDDQQSLTLNSANILIPRLPDFSVKAVLCLLNSKLLQFVFAKKFNTHKVLRGDLEQLPLPLLHEDVLQRLELLAERGIRGEPVISKIDKVIFEALPFSKSEIDLISSAVA